MPDKDRSRASDDSEREAGREWTDPWVAERAIMLQVLRDDHALCWTREQLQEEISDIEPANLDRAVVRLRQEGCVLTKDDMVRASRGARWLDDLGMVSI